MRATTFLCTALLALTAGGCRDSDQPEDTLAGCGERDYLTSIAAAKLAEDRQSVKFAYEGSQPCQFAAVRNAGRLYVELRVPTRSTDAAQEPGSFGCVEGVLERAPAAGTPLELITRKDPRPEVRAHARAYLRDQDECPPVARGQARFVID